MELTLPLLGDVMTEGTLTRWLVADGTQVNRGEALYEVESDKVTLTVDAPEGGTIQRVVGEGDTVPVGTVVGRLVSGGPHPHPPLRVGLSLEGEAASVVSGESAPWSPAATDNVRATPAARALARQLGVDLRAIGNGRRLREADVRAFAARPTTAKELAGRRKVIAERMRASLAQTAQLTVSMEVDMTDALRLHEQLKQLLAEDRRPTITDLVIRAAALALGEHPALNATLEDGHLRLHSDVNVGVAVDADEGLIVPVIQRVAELSLVDLAQRSRAMARRARDNELTADDLRGGTFTVTSLGPLGVDFFTPIVNPPQVAILGIGRVVGRLVMRDGQVQERQHMYLNLSFDHQAVDGAPAARFLQTVKRMLELPASLVVDTRQ